MSDDGPDYDTLERCELLADEVNELRDLAMEYKAKLQQAEDADVAFRLQVRKDCENAESAPVRIKAALGEYGKDWSGDWLDEACDRLTRKRVLTKDELADALDEMLARDAPTSEILDTLCNMLGVTLRASTDRPASPIDTERDQDP